VTGTATGPAFPVDLRCDTFNDGDANEDAPPTSPRRGQYSGDLRSPSSPDPREYRHGPPDLVGKRHLHGCATQHPDLIAQAAPKTSSTGRRTGHPPGRSSCRGRRPPSYQSGRTTPSREVGGRDSIYDQARPTVRRCHAERVERRHRRPPRWMLPWRSRRHLHDYKPQSRSRRPTEKNGPLDGDPRPVQYGLIAG